MGASAALAGGLVILAGACSSDPGTSYGNPNTLSRTNLPGGDEAGTAAVSCADAGVPDAVSFSANIYPLLKADGAWKCAKAGCHATGGTQPEIDDTSAQACYQSLTKAQPIGTTPYVNSGSKDINQSAIYCNIGTHTCGSPMPKDTTGVKQPTASEICILQAWVQAGSPNN